MTKAEKVAFLRGLMAGTRQITEILPFMLVDFHQVVPDQDQYVRALDGKVFSMAQLEEMEERSHRFNNQFFIVHADSSIPIAECEEDIIM